MEQSYPMTDLLRASRKGELQKEGDLPAIGATYSFHGIGCRFQVGTSVVNIDFGPDGRHDGFDAWRLWLFADSQGERGLDLPSIKAGLRVLETERIVQKIEAAFAP